MNNVRHLLRDKGNSVWSISPNITVFHALERLAEKHIGALVVVENDKVVGMFSERDYARKVILKGKSSVNTTVAELMSTTVYTVSPADTIEECMEIMSERRIRHLPVVEDETLVGLISIGDVVNHIISHQQFKIRELEKYITGSYG